MAEAAHLIAPAQGVLLVSLTVAGALVLILLVVETILRGRR